MVTLPDNNGARGRPLSGSFVTPPELLASKQYPVFYHSEPGILTLTDKVFHYQSHDTSPDKNASVKCSWARVEKRQLSPPGTGHPQLKLVLVSGRTAVFEVEKLPQLLALVKDVKLRMDCAVERKAHQEQEKLAQENERLANQQEEDLKAEEEEAAAQATNKSPLIPPSGPPYPPPPPPPTTGFEDESIHLEDLNADNAKPVSAVASNNKKGAMPPKKDDGLRGSKNRASVAPVLPPLTEENDDNKSSSALDVEQAPGKDSPGKESTASTTDSDRARDSTPSTVIVSEDFDTIKKGDGEEDTDEEDKKKASDDEDSASQQSRKKGGCLAFLDNSWSWMCLVMTLIAIALFAVVLYLLLGNGDDGNSSLVTPPPGVNCDEIECPPDYGLEGRYGIRRVDYVWTPEYLRLEYIISDYILDGSINFAVWDGQDCRGKDQQVNVKNNTFLWVELVDSPEVDGGTNLYNEGKGKRHLDILIRLLGGVDVTTAPFYVQNGVVGMSWYRFCVGFYINYNQVDDYTGLVEVRAYMNEHAFCCVCIFRCGLSLSILVCFIPSCQVNFIENAVQLDIDTNNATFIRDAEVRTATVPSY